MIGSSKAWLATIVFIASSFVYAQFEPFEIPSTEQQTADLEKAIANAGIPPPAQIWQEQQSASNHALSYQNAGSRMAESKAKLEQLPSTFVNNLIEAQNVAKKCEPGSKARLEYLISIGGAIPFDESFRDYQSERQVLDSLPEKDLCRQLSAPEEIKKLQDMVTADTKKYLELLGNQIRFAKRLQDAYQARSTALAAEQKKAAAQETTTQNLVSYLWLIILVLAVFGAGVLLAVRVFDKDVQMELIGSGQVVQFPTVMTLLVVIISLGLTGTLKENSLPALLGGLAGYVLSQGVGRASLRPSRVGSGSALWISAQNLAFGNVTVNTTSNPQIIHVVNTGKDSINLTISITGDFSQSNTCNGPLLPGASCAVNISFKPTATGTRSGTLEFDDGNSTQVVSLTGIGV